MKKLIVLASLMAACFSLTGCVIVPDGPGGPRAHGYYYEEGGYHHGCWRC